MEYQESRHTVLDLLRRINAKFQTWKAPYRSQETVLVLLQDWHVRGGHQNLLHQFQNNNPKNEYAQNIDFKYFNYM